MNLHALGYQKSETKFFYRALFFTTLAWCELKLNAREKTLHAGNQFEDFETHFRKKWFGKFNESPHIVGQLYRVYFMNLSTPFYTKMWFLKNPYVFH
jgi:hypothetical protein